MVPTQPAQSVPSWRSIASRWVLLGALLAAPAASPAQAPDGQRQTAVDVWRKEDGLPSDTVNAIAQTHDGCLWVGTSGGLVRFDGIRFVRARPEPLNAGSIHRLFTDREGGLWIAAAGGHLWRWREGRFDPFDATSGWTHENIQSFALDEQGLTVFSTEHGGILRFASGRFHQVLPNTTNALRTTEIAADRWGDGTLWVRRGASVGVLRGTQWTEVTRPTGPPARVGAMTPRREGGVWIFSAERNLDVLQRGAWVQAARRYPPFMDPSRMLEDSVGHLWIGTPRQGLVQTSTTGRLVRYFTGTGFPTDAIRTLFEDREGNVWVGGNSSGLVRLSRSIFSALGPGSSLPNTAPLCLVQTRAHGVCVAYAEQGIYQVADTATGVVASHLDPGKHPRSAWALLEGADDRIWFPVYAVGLLAIHGRESQKWAAAEGLPTNDIHALAEDGEGTLWLGTVQGLIRFDGSHFVNVTQTEGLPAGEVSCLALAPDGSLWIGTDGAGLIQRRNGQAKVLTTADGLPSNIIKALQIDPDGSVWAGTAAGLAWRQNDRFFSFGPDSGVPGADISGIVDDRIGHLWLATSRGVLRAARDELVQLTQGRRDPIAVRRFTEKDGLPTVRASGGQPNAIRAEDGRLWFATQKGLAVVDPRDVRPQPIPPQVDIEEVLVDGVPVLDASLEAGRGPSATGSDTRPLHLHPGTRRVEIRYTAPNLTTPDLVRFRRAVDGLDDGWEDVGAERSAVFHGLRPGRYRLRVLAANADGIWSDSESSVTFIVPPWFWETLWFRALLAVVAALTLGGFVRRRFQNAEARRAAQEWFSRQLLEQQEAERKRMAAEMHDSLGQSLSIIQNHAVLAGIARDRAENPAPHLEGISQAAVEALASVREICQGLRPVELDRLGLTRTLQAVTDRLAERMRLRITSEFDPVDSLVPKADWIHVLRFLQEALNNVVKHARASHVTVTLREDEHRLHLKVTDDGIGFDPGTAARGRSLGLTTMEERARILKAEFHLESAAGRGTSLRLTIPVTPTANEPTLPPHGH